VLIMRKGVGVMPFVTAEVEGGMLTLLGGDEAMVDVIEKECPIDLAFDDKIFREVYRHPDGTRLNIYGSVRGRGLNEHILWGDVEVAS